MIKKYVKGSSTNPEGVIKALEELGGINKYYYKGSDPDFVYFINTDKYIELATNESSLFNIILDCFEEIQPVEPEPAASKVITNKDVTKWYFQMLRSGHCVQFRYGHDYDSGEFIFGIPCAYVNDEDETRVKRVRIDFGKWIPIEEAGINK